MFTKLSKFVTTYPRLVLLAWLVILLSSLPFAARVNEVLSSDSGSAPQSTANTVQEVLATSFVSNPRQQLLLVATPTTPSTDAFNNNEDYRELINALELSPLVNNILDYQDSTSLQLRTEGGSAIAIVTLNSADSVVAEHAVQELSAQLPEDGDYRFFFSGGAATDLELQNIAQKDRLRAELIGLPISLLVLIVIFGALVAAGLPLLIALTSIVLSYASLFFLGQLFPFATFAQTIVTMLGLATGIDYSLLMVNRYREELRQGQDPQQAVMVTISTAGKAVFSSGLTVLLALCSLLIPPLSFIQSIGIGGITVMLFSVLVSITVLPAIFCLLGSRINALQIRPAVSGSHSRRFWRTRALQVLEHPYRWAILGTLALLMLSLPAVRMQVAVAGAKGLSENTDAYQTYVVLEEAELEGFLRSFDVLIDFGSAAFITLPQY